MFRRLSIKAAPLNILMLINVFFHFYFTCAGDVLQMRCSSFFLSFIRFVFVFAAFVILHDRIFASCHQSHAIFKLYLYTQCLCLCSICLRTLQCVILFNQSLIIKYRMFAPPPCMCICQSVDAVQKIISNGTLL